MILRDAWEVVVVGAGAAGLMAGIRAAELGRRTLVLEKNRKPGVKILMSGGTRCNLTHATDNRGIVEAFGPSGRFLHSALAALSVRDTIELFEQEGVATKVESTGKIFPESNKATDVLAALVARLNRSGAQVALDEPLKELVRDGDHFRLKTSNRTLEAEKVIITTGGVSYPGCGTTGDGYRWAEAFGHTMVRPRPALTPVTVDAQWVRSLQGVTIPDVRLRVVERTSEGMPPSNSGSSARPAVLDDRRGSFLFTHFGLSGPVVLDVSRVISGHAEPRRLGLVCDFLPTIEQAALDESLRRAAEESGRKLVTAILPESLPARLAEHLLEAAGISPNERAGEFGRAKRAALVERIKQLPIAVSGTRGFKKAEVTAGGVELDEIDSRTLESKRAKNLFLAGEVLDLDGPIGGYNFQAAWSTGWLAGQSV